MARVITYKTFISEKTVKDAIKSGRYKHLNESWGVMHKWWAEKTYYGYPLEIRAIAIAYSNRQPIGGCIMLKDGHVDFGCNIAVYVNPNYRTRGIGTKLLRLLKRHKQTILSDPTKRTFFNKALNKV